MGRAFGKTSRWRAAIPVIPILVGFVAVSLAFNVTVPLLEAPDETSHVAMVRFIEAHHALPVQRPPADFPVGQEGSQPPLYYLFGAALFHLSPRPALAPAFPQQNPFVSFKRSTAAASNRNFYEHTSREGFPYRGDVLGLHLARLVGLVMGSITVLFSFLIAREVWPRRHFLAAVSAGLVAFNPQFGFMSGVVNNDNAIAMGATVVLWCLVRWIIRGGSTRLAVALGVSLAAALLAKTDGILLIPLVALVLGADFLRQGRSRVSIVRGLIVAFLAATLAGWWFVRNQLLYGDPLGWTAMLAANHAMLRRSPISVWSAMRVLWNARGTYWGVFGWTNVLYPPSVYRLIDVFTLVVAIGLAVSLWKVYRATDREPGRFGYDWSFLLKGDGSRILALALLIIWPPMVYVSLVHWVQINDAANQWRLFFAAISPMAVLMALGLDGIRILASELTASHLPRREAEPAGEPVFAAESSHARRRPDTAGERRPFARLPGPSRQKDVCPARSSDSPGSFASDIILLALPAVFVTLVGLAINARVIATVIIPAFYPTVAVASSATTDTGIRFGGDIELVKSTVRPKRLRSGDALEVDLDWRALQPPTKNWSVSLGVVDGAGATLAKAQSWPEGGRAPTTTWQPGLIYKDRYVLFPTWTSSDPQLANVWLNLYDASVVGGPSLPVTTGSGQTIGNGVVIGHVKLMPTSHLPLRPSKSFKARFGPSIDLLGYDAVEAPDELRLTLYWRDEAGLKDAYTVFVHVAGANGKVLAQNDSPPRGGAYPTTAWEPGETIRDQHVVALKGVPAGRYQVLVGIYLRSTGQRLPVRLPNGAHAPNDALRLFDLNVSPNGR